MKYTYTSLPHFLIKGGTDNQQAVKKSTMPVCLFVFNLIITDAVSWLIYNYIATLHHL